MESIPLLRGGGGRRGGRGARRNQNDASILPLEGLDGPTTRRRNGQQHHGNVSS